MSVVDELLEDSAAGRTLDESSVLWRESLDGDEATRAAQLLRELPDARGYHLLVALRRSAPDTYASVPADLRARVLLDVLGQQRILNDWGYLDPTRSYDGPAAAALLDTGDAALPGLTAMLDDRSPVDLEGSEESMMADTYSYRRADFAYRYLSLLTGRDATFIADHGERDAAIDRLRGELG
jgi:hypothetical protein